jgi:hypothetical protein
MVSIESPLTLVIGNGMFGEEDDEMMQLDSLEGNGDVDDFQEIGTSTDGKLF